LKFKNCKGTIYHDADWIAGMDYDENIKQDKVDNEDNKAYKDDNNEYPKDKQNIDEDKDDQIDDDELEDLNEDARQDDNPNQQLEQDEVVYNNQAKDDNEDKGTAVISEQESDSRGSKLRSSTRTSRPVSRLEPNMSGKLYMQDDKKKRIVSFAEDKLRQLEYCHNLVLQVRPDDQR
jgi:hypothetical protein